jgi:hypothetical protein
MNSCELILICIKLLNIIGYRERLKDNSGEKWILFANKEILKEKKWGGWGHVVTKLLMAIVEIVLKNGKQYCALYLQENLVINFN